MTTSTRPTVDFGADARGTARAYAVAANSRVLPPPAQKLLKQAAQGAKVDAYDLNDALTHAMRSASTRLGQSMARRELTRKIAHLAHITQAVLEAHADGLPVYDDQGVRSRKIEEQGRALDHAAEVNQALTRDLTLARDERALLTQAASDERRRLCAEIDRLAKEAGALQRTVEQATKDRERWLAATYYAIDLTDAETGARVRGYIDGWNEAKA